MGLRRPISPSYATPHEAIAYLASVYDGAIRRDGHGFATEHVHAGHGLAQRGRWGRRHRRTALELIRYYRGQLERAGFDVQAVIASEPDRIARQASARLSSGWAIGHAAIGPMCKAETNGAGSRLASYVRSGFEG